MQNFDPISSVAKTIIDITTLQDGCGCDCGGGCGLGAGSAGGVLIIKQSDGCGS